jgi:hypothetical protein
MRKLLSILFLIISVNVWGQFPSTTHNGSVNTNTVNDGMLSGAKGLWAGSFSDTTAANLVTWMKGTPFVMITTGQTLWIRSNPANRWVRVSGSCNGLQAGTGIVSWSGTGLVFNSTTAIFCINNNSYTALAGSTTLATANPSLPRIDIIVADTFGLIGHITGTAAVNPQTPQVDATKQVYLTSVLVPAASTVPGGITQTIVYDENTGTPTEWNSSSSLSVGTVNFNSTSFPYHSTKNAVTTTGATGTLTWTNSSAVNKSDYTNLTLYIRLDATSSSDVGANLLLGGSVITTSSIGLSSYGFNPLTVGSYQTIIIPMSAFPTSSLTFDAVQVKFNTLPQAHFDYINLQGGIPTGSSPYITNVYRKTGTDSVFQVRNGISEFAFIDSTGGGGITPTIFTGGDFSANSIVKMRTKNVQFIDTVSNVKRVITFHSGSNIFNVSATNLSTGAANSFTFTATQQNTSLNSATTSYNQFIGTAALSRSYYHFANDVQSSEGFGVYTWSIGVPVSLTSYPDASQTGIAVDSGYVKLGRFAAPQFLFNNRTGRVTFTALPNNAPLDSIATTDASGNLILKHKNFFFPPSSDFYSINGSLTSYRTVDGNGYGLLFKNVPNFWVFDSSLNKYHSYRLAQGVQLIDGDSVSTAAITSNEIGGINLQFNAIGHPTDSTNKIQVTKTGIAITATQPISINGVTQYPTTITTPGTTGDQTINKNSGRVNVAAGATSITVTDSLVTTNTIIIPVLRGNDVTAIVQNIKVLAGSFTVYFLIPPTAETPLDFLITNQ